MPSPSPALLSALPVEPSTFALFVTVSGALALTPGPAVLFTVATGVAQGPQAVVKAVAGITAATALWFLGAALGLSALVAAFPQQFHLLAIVGALYVAWLGLKALMAAFSVDGKAPLVSPNAQTGRPFLRGLGVQLANPKAVLFFTAVLPPFMDPTRAAAPQLLAFAASSLSLDALSLCGYGLAGARLSMRLQEPRFRRAFNVLVGVLLLSSATLIILKS